MESFYTNLFLHCVISGALFAIIDIENYVF
jgi:hypothetical protein